MAGYQCSLCAGDEPASLLVTPLTGGETMAVGENCMAIALAGMLAGHLDIDADKLWAAAERLIKRAQADAAKRAPAVDAEPLGEPTPEGWANGLCQLHCREDRCGPNGERCDCPGHQGSTHTPQVAKADSVFVRVPHGTPDEDEEDEK